MADDTFAAVNVLIVDDGMFSRQTLERTLKNMGVASVLAAETGDEALALLAQGETAVGLVITDIMMRGMDGFELVKRIRAPADGAVRDVPILVLTGQKMDARKKESIEDLIDGFIDKPATVKVLTAMMAKALKL